jgi:hypothetical protein
MIPHSDPERSKLLDEKKARLDVLWLKGHIGDSTYLRSLFIDGYLPRDANVELSLLRMEKANALRKKVV